MISDTKIAVGYALLAASVLWILYCLAWYYRASTRPDQFPPGPKALPFLGHLHIFPPTKSFLKFHEWGKQYGSIIGLKLGPQNVVVLNDYKHVQELFDKRGAIYSSRPPSHIARELIYHYKPHILFVEYGDEWRAMRKAVQDLLRSNRVDNLLPIQQAESTATLHLLLNDPDGWFDHICRFSTSVILASVFGLRGTTFQSPRVQDFYHAQHQTLSIGEIGATPPIDIFPFLKYLPDFVSPWRKWALEIRKEHRILYLSLLRESKDHMKTVDAPSCLIQRLIEMSEKGDLDEGHIPYVAGEMHRLEGGSDTTAAILQSFVLAMAKYPNVLLRCQKEVDEVCGSERLPDLGDFKSLQYIRAVMNETLRWRPVAPSGIPHALTQDDFYEGYFFPKGTIFFANAWSIHRTDEYTAADDFVPERFLHNKFGIDPEKFTADNDKRRTQYGFGAGRRVCPGQLLAEKSLMICMAKLVWAFNIEPGTDDLSDSMEDTFHGGLLTYPIKFPVRFTPRSAAHAELIEKEYTAELPFLNRFG